MLSNLFLWQQQIGISRQTALFVLDVDMPGNTHCSPQETCKHVGAHSPTGWQLFNSCWHAGASTAVVPCHAWMPEWVSAYRHVLALRINPDPECSSQVVVLQRGLIIVNHRNGVGCFDEEVIVEASMLKVMHDSRPVAGQVQAASKGIGLEQAPMAQQHVGHLQHRRHMQAASYQPTASAAAAAAAAATTLEQPKQHMQELHACWPDECSL